ncbi:MAG: hypothetical protein ACLQNE_12475 [Thermoguttaceae bacterium]|jgi:hypothetical protein
MMEDDPIITEIRMIREEHARRFNHDVRAMGEDLRKRQFAGGRKVVSFAKGYLEVIQEPACVNAPSHP